MLECGLGSLFEVTHGAFDCGRGKLGFPFFVFHVQFAVVGGILTVAKHVASTDVFLKSVEVDWVNVLPVKGDAVAQAESEGIQDLGSDPGWLSTKVVHFQVGRFGIESGGAQV